MKKLITIVSVGLAILILLMFMPSNNLNTLTSEEKENSYLTLVPAKPPKPPTK